MYDIDIAYLKSHHSAYEGRHISELRVILGTPRSTCHRKWREEEGNKFKIL